MMSFQSNATSTNPGQSDLFVEHPGPSTLRDVDGPYQLPKLGFEVDALEPLYSAESVITHYNKLHRAQVARANEISRQLTDVRREGNLDEWVHLQNELDFNLAGHFLHSVFWRNIAPCDGDSCTPSRDLVRHIERSFRGFDEMRTQFWAAGGSIRGCGWVGLVWDYTSGTLAIRHIHERHGPRATDPVPLLVMDMWEHAYFLRHHDRKEGWMKDFWDLINWRDVSHNFDVVKMYRPAVPSDPGSLSE